MDEAKRVTTAFNNLRVVAPVPVLQKASALNAAVLALTQATTVPLAKPPLMAEAAKAFEDFTMLFALSWDLMPEQPRTPTARAPRTWKPSPSR
jgi:hypothetical protein